MEPRIHCTIFQIYFLISSKLPNSCYMEVCYMTANFYSCQVFLFILRHTAVWKCTNFELFVHLPASFYLYCDK